MARMDGTGPMGQGPMTGRGMGPCGGGIRAGWCGRGQGRGVGFGRFFRSPKNQLQALEDEEKMLLKELEAVKAEKESLKGQK
ncbi:MAG: DUF5320 domain-containing protein [Patescibacteria group bacterium]